MTPQLDYFLRTGRPLNRRRPRIRPAVKYAIAAWLAVGALVAGIAVFITAVTR